MGVRALFLLRTFVLLTKLNIYEPKAHNFKKQNSKNGDGVN